MNAKQSCLNCDSTGIVALFVCFAPWIYWAVKWSQLLGRVCHAVVFSFADFICFAVVRFVQEFARLCCFLSVGDVHAAVVLCDVFPFSVLRTSGSDRLSLGSLTHISRFLILRGLSCFMVALNSTILLCSVILLMVFLEG